MLGRSGHLTRALYDLSGTRTGTLAATGLGLLGSVASAAEVAVPLNATMIIDVVIASERIVMVSNLIGAEMKMH